MWKVLLVWLDKCTYCRFGGFSIKYVSQVALSLFLRSFGVG